jgi:thiamine-monophosphate kinase
MATVPLPERSLIAEIRRAARSRHSEIPVGIGDDCAVLRPRPNHELLVTTDFSLEGIHFRRDWHSPESAGHRCLARGLSDIAAMGGEPRCFLLSLALPSSHSGKWMTDFLRGLVSASRKLKCPLAGGDTTRSDRVLININVVGELGRGRAVQRSGARPGDRIFVSGRLGEAELGLRLARQLQKNGGGHRNSLLQQHLYPEARVELGKWLAERKLATAMMDLSDGLSSDLARLCGASKTGAQIELDRVPMAAGKFSRRFTYKDRVRAALHGGDDYELLFCVANRDLRHIPNTFRGVKLTEIGRITKGRAMELADSSRGTVPLRPLGWDPF